MTEVVGIVLAVLALWLVIAAVALALAARRVGRANRVAAGVPSPAPLRWHWSHSRPARLHRRLQVAVWPIDPARPHPELPPAVGTDELRADLVKAALDTDIGLVRLRHAPARLRRTGWREASAQVVVIEELAARLRGAPPPPRWSRPPMVRSPALDELAERVACLEHGRAQVAHVEALGTGSSAPIRPTPTPTR